ncbi:EAL domain-containing protein [Shewanella sp. ULN5]|uniref:EAL domain-containing protein n=1 Tax=Shewanella sp. ULN5 TaxID=2994678 RepID=UPI00273D3C87|nr:EAL domain-containing protein [Shewanella sp. ULN5]MDP5145263.1 EAL domain-containing protein [Shewanella sp. ULN5]
MTLFPNFLRHWLLISIAHKIQFFSLIFTSIVILIIGSVSYTLLHKSISENVREHIDHEANLTGNKLQFLFKSVTENINKLSLNALVMNSLVDSSGRESYLLPFLRSEQDFFNIPVNIVLTDFQGAVIAANSIKNKAGYTVRPEIEQAISTGLPVSSIYNDPTGTMLLLVKPIIFPPTRQTEGFLVVWLKLDDIFDQSVQNLQEHFHAELTTSNYSLKHGFTGDTELSSINYEMFTDFSGEFPAFKFSLKVGQDEAKAFSYLNNLTYIIIIITPLLLLLVFFITGKISKKIAGPIIFLNKLTGNIAREGNFTGALSVPKSDSFDEVGQLTNAFNLMLNQLKFSYESLEKKVLNRTFDLQQSELRFRAMADNSPAMIWTSNAELSVDFYNQQIVDFSGRGMSELQTLGFFDLVHPEDEKIVTSERAAAFEQKKPFKLEYRLKNCQGEYRFILENCVTKTSSSGDFDGYIGLCIDITSRIFMEEQLRLAAAVFEKSSQGIIICDVKNRIVSVNKGFTKLMGYEPGDLLSKNPNIFSSGQHQESFYSLMWDKIKKEGAWQGEVWNKHRNGKVLPEWLTINVIKDDSDNITHYIGMYYDISERKENEQRIEYLAYHDSLTGLPNRTLFKDRLEQATFSALRHERSFALLYLDLDHFKVINDTLGHDVGDDFLKIVAYRLKSGVRENDTVARVGGDEFILIIEDVSGIDAIVNVIQKLMGLLTESYQIKNDIVYSSPSIGVAVYPNDSETAAELIKQADIAMYQAKAKGRNTFVFYAPEMNKEILQRSEIESKLRLALERGDELDVYLQPQIEMSSGKIIGAEALVRWEHPDIGFISPADFIPVAEACGLILPVGKFVLNKVLNAIHTRQANKLHCVPISVNISAVQFSHHDFLIDTAEMIDNYTFDMELLQFEITESIFIKEPNNIAETMHTINAMGIKFSLDDFGTGYSSLSYLRKFPISTLKIDQSFIRDLTIDKEDAALTVAIITMAHSLGLKVIAEGLETIEQESFLLENNCKIGQGYLYAKPMPINEFFSKIDSV